MKRLAVKILIILFVVSLFSITVQAKTDETDALKDSLSGDAKDIMDQWDFDPTAPQDFSFSGIFDGLKDVLFSKITDPVKTIALLLVVIVLLATFNALSISEKSNEIIGFITSVVFATGLCIPMTQIISDTFEMLKSFMVFSTSLVTVYITVLLSAGKAAASGTFSGVVFVASEVISYLINYLFVPVAGGYFALSLAAVISDEDHISNILTSIKKTLIFSLGLCVTVYSAVITVLGSLNASVDSVGQKTVSFVSSTAVPIVGKAVSDAVGAVFSSLSVIKSGVGIYGILGIVATVLPTVIGLLIWKLGFVLTGAAAGGFSLHKVSKCISALGDGISVIISLVVVSSLVFIISLAMIK